jgi:hypothetical protein
MLNDFNISDRRPSIQSIDEMSDHSSTSGAWGIWSNSGSRPFASSDIISRLGMYKEFMLNGCC